MFQKNETFKALKECYLMSNIPKRNLASGCHLLKKIDQPSWRTTRLNYKHIPQIVCISSRFRVLHLLSWEFEQPEVLWRYTVILVFHLKHVEVGGSTRNYPQSHRSFVINMYVITMLYFSVKFPSVTPKKARKQPKKKEENFDWTLVNTENLRV